MSYMPHAVRGRPTSRGASWASEMCSLDSEAGYARAASERPDSSAGSSCTGSYSLLVGGLVSVDAAHADVVRSAAAAVAVREAVLAYAAILVRRVLDVELEPLEVCRADSQAAQRVQGRHLLHDLLALLDLHLFLLDLTRPLQLPLLEFRHG